MVFLCSVDMEVWVVVSVEVWQLVEVEWVVSLVVKVWKVEEGVQCKVVEVEKQCKK